MAMVVVDAAAQPVAHHSIFYFTGEAAASLHGLECKVALRPAARAWMKEKGLVLGDFRQPVLVDLYDGSWRTYARCYKK